MNPVRVAIVDDARFVRDALTRLLDEDDRVRVVGCAATGEELLAKLDVWRPDVITLDLSMPGMGGMAALRHVMETRPTPVIILSTHSSDGAALAVEALAQGAVDCLDKEAYSMMDFDALRRGLLERILAVGRPVVGDPQKSQQRLYTVEDASAEQGPQPRRHNLLLIGASTGGPPAIERVLADLNPADTPPIVIVQHMPAGFTKAFAERLHRCLDFTVVETSDGHHLEPGRVYIGSAGHQIALKGGHEGISVTVSASPPDAQHSPSVDTLFHSAVLIKPKRTAAVLLTGMGKDGASGMSALVQAGAHTIVQDEASSVVFGMPGAAVALNAAREVVPLNLIAARLQSLFEPENASKRGAPTEHRHDGVHR